MMRFNKNKLIEFLEILEEELDGKITLVAAGGTAMTLLNLKTSTIDVDFSIPHEDIQEFESALKKVPHGFKIDYWADGMVFSQTLPDDYLEKSIPMKTTLARIELRALHPIDIVATKIGRLNERDLQDIQSCIEKYRLTKKQVRERAKAVDYVGHEEVYQINLAHVLKNFFTKRRTL